MLAAADLSASSYAVEILLLECIVAQHLLWAYCTTGSLVEYTSSCVTVVNTVLSVQVTNQRFWMPAWPILELLDGRAFQLAADVRVIKDFAMHIINTRRQQLKKTAVAAEVHADTDTTRDQDSAGSARDLLSLFMEAKGPDGKLLTDKQLVDTVLNFIIAGRDTTAQVSCSTLIVFSVV